MERWLGLLGVLALNCFGASAILPGDAQRGRQLFLAQNCIGCHSVDGQGGARAADLAKRIGRDSTPSMMATLVWNNAPAMWAAVEKQGRAIPRLTEQQIADLYAYFYSARFFERPGDTGRGMRVFDWKRCVACHGASSAARPAARPVTEWQPAADAIALLEQMWDHAGQMKAALADKKINWPELSFQELADLLVYLQTVRRPGGQAVEIPASGESGEALFNLKGCKGCHTGTRSHANRYMGRNLTDFAMAMWNNAPKMARKPQPFRYGEMRQIAGYLWTLQLLGPPGNAVRGRQVFARKNCANCHNNALSGAPSLTARPGGMHPFKVAAALWQHGPNMKKRMEQKQTAWPRFTSLEMADLVEYLSGPATGPPSHTHR